MRPFSEERVARRLCMNTCAAAIPKQVLEEVGRKHIPAESLFLNNEQRACCGCDNGGRAWDVVEHLDFPKKLALAQHRQLQAFAESSRLTVLNVGTRN